VKEDIASKLVAAEGVLAALPGLAKRNAPLTWASRDQRPLKLATLKAKNVFIEASTVASLNNRIFAPENILKYSKNQTFTGKISAGDVKIDRAVVNTLSGMNTEGKNFSLNTVNFRGSTVYLRIPPWFNLSAKLLRHRTYSRGNDGLSSLFFSLLLDSTHYRPAMPFRNRKTYFRVSFRFSIVIIQKISSSW